MTDYKTIVGMEIHVELKTNSKMFCGCKNDPFHAPKPNIYTCPVCLGLPGALPVPNKKAVEWTIMLGLALNCQIQELSKFDRKNYFYPDLPKGYQISQYDQPLCKNGHLVISNEVRNLGSEATGTDLRFARSLANARDDKKEGKKIRIQRVHLEEDTGKLLHSTINGEKVTLIDFNRSGVPLVEIVTEPDINSSDEAKAFLKKLHQIVRYLGISDADMEKGSMRLEPNISVAVIPSPSTALRVNSVGGSLANASVNKLRDFSPVKSDRNDNHKLPNYKVEVKNINSFKFVVKAIDFEVKRHIEIIKRGETPAQETRGWEEKKGITLPQRSKEEAHDYRYFPEPDIPPMRFSESQILKIKDQIPEMPDTRLTRFINDFGLPVQDAQRLIEEKEVADYFESVQRLASSGGKKDISQKTIANWILNKNVDIRKVAPEEMLQSIFKAKTVITVDEKELLAIVKKILKSNEKAVVDYKSGKTGVLMFLLGQVMRELRGQADAQVIRIILEKELQ